MNDMTNAEALDRHGCAICFKAVYDPTDEEARRGTCQDCHHRQMDAALVDWRAFKDQHAEALGREAR